ncbi:LEF-4 [Mauternbach virus]|uniref:LEF-4 n=1 Tax=Mauternbach virus TaxID=2486603 RepID=A0A3G3E882_9VIRU|nr:LEF-4 [Mauternbach virus]AYP97913.1 LEF-4 [Mauternbach virus]
MPTTVNNINVNNSQTKNDNHFAKNEVSTESQMKISAITSGSKNTISPPLQITMTNKLIVRPATITELNSTPGSLIDEWESTISRPITEQQYNKYKCKPYKCDVIFLFKDGTRLSCRTMQKKTTTYCRNLISFHKNKWYPIQRTTAIESMQTLPNHYTCDKIIYRIIVYHQKNLRVSYNMEECANGAKYNMEYEIEYQKDTPYHEILMYERKLINVAMSDNFEIKRQILSLVDLFSYVMTKVQMWHCFNPLKDYIWAYKWNGIKAKLLITDKLSENGANLTYIWPDANDIAIEECRGTNISPLINFCFLVEIMADCIVLIEAIGASIEQNIYTTEPVTNSYVLKYLKDQKTQLTIGNKPVVIQEFYSPPLPNFYDMTQFDGLIIIQDDMIIKWKIPTIDVKCIDGFKYKVADAILTLNFEGNIGKIYEMSYKNEILRERNDRIVDSSPQEYAVFLESSKQLLENPNDDQLLYEKITDGSQEIIMAPSTSSASQPSKIKKNVC